jgi:hypothetical protein
MGDAPEQAEELRQRLKQAIAQARSGLQWKPGKAQEHLAKRIERGHLPPGTTLADYSAIIQEVVSSAAAQVYVYHFADVDYPALVAEHSRRPG